MIKDKEWVGKDFSWFFGVVEDVQDPLNIGRVRVRCFGHHTDNVIDLPTEDLPWAQVMMPVTSASFSGIGTSATGLITGAHVVGFFMDGENAQMPMIMGTFPGVTTAQDFFRGFSDPWYTYPKEYNIPDTPKLAYDKFLEDKVTEEKIKNRVNDVPKAAKHHLRTAKNKPGVKYENYDLDDALVPDEAEFRDPLVWSEPLNRGGKVSAYPDNHVTQTTSGHAFEIDDTDSCERIHQYHRTGTFYEIQPDGSRMTKIVNKDYEITVSDKNVFVKGTCNLTVEGDVRQYFKSNLIQEVQGDYHLTVHGDMLTKVVKNQATDVLGNRSTQINGDQFMRLSGNNTSIIAKNSSESIKLDHKVTINGNYKENVAGNSNQTITGDDTRMVIGHYSLGVAESVCIASVSYMKITTADYLKTHSYSTWNHTSGGLYTDTSVPRSGGNITITGGPNVYINPVA
jgi:hypothetical protein